MYRIHADVDMITDTDYKNRKKQLFDSALQFILFTDVMSAQPTGRTAMCHP